MLTSPVRTSSGSITVLPSGWALVLAPWKPSNVVSTVANHAITKM